MSAGKGSKPRPVDLAKYQANYDAIFRPNAIDLIEQMKNDDEARTKQFAELRGIPVSSVVTVTQKIPVPPPGNYPDWICRPCGWQYGRFPSMDRISAWHEGTCGICGQRGPVTEPRDFGHLQNLPTENCQLPTFL